MFRRPTPLFSLGWSGLGMGMLSNCERGGALLAAARDSLLLLRVFREPIGPGGETDARLLIRRTRVRFRLVWPFSV